MAAIAASGSAILGATIQVLLDKALSFAAERVGLLYGFSKDLETLRRSFQMIQAVLAVADESDASKRQDVQLWLQCLEDVAYDAYYALDEFKYEIVRHEVKSRNKHKGKVCSFFFFSQNCRSISFRLKMAPRIRSIISKLKIINEEAHQFGLTTNRMATPLNPSITFGETIERESDSVVGPYVVGREDDESNVVKILLSCAERVVSVLPIVGMGGLGKTTLAKLVFSNKQIQNHFSKRIWVCVPDKKFEGTKVFKLILEQLWGRNVQLDSRDAIVQQIQKEVEGRRYLLVLDDIWNENQEKWVDFFESLEGLSKMSERSWCLVTSRKLATARVVATHHQYSLGKLSDSCCWMILKEKATGSGEVPDELIAIKEQAIKRCAGLPLTAKVLGGLLRVQRKEEWPSIVEKRLSDVVQDHESNAMQILKLSFHYLPSPSIKKCFAYLSIFKEDSEMDGDELIRLWMAEGFLQPDLRNEITMEKIGDNYLKILLQSSLLEEVRDQRKRVFYKLHDLVHDLARSLSKKETIILEDGVIDNNSRAKYLALDSFGETPEKILTDLSKSVRTLFLKSGISDKILSKFMNLQVLKLSGKEIVELPNTIGKLKHMRYLDILEPKMKTLPESLCKLYNLQTLKMGSSLQSFPDGMSNLISLRHLDHFSDDSEFQMPIEMGQLTCIQTLRFFNIGGGKGRGIEELGCLEELQGKLAIRNLELVKSKEEALWAKLSRKQNLIELEFCWGSKDREGIHSYDELVLEGLEPCLSLQALSIKNFMGVQFPGWFQNLSLLVRLSLENCKSCLQLPVLGHLPCLEYLHFSELDKLSCIGTSFYRLHNGTGGAGRSLSRRKLFPALKTLIFENIWNLTEWKEVEEGVDDGDAVFPLLEYLTIDHCPQLITGPTHFPTLRSLEIRHNDHPSIARRILSKVTGAFGISVEEMDGLTCLSDVIGIPLDVRSSNLTHLVLERCPNIMYLSGCGTSLLDLHLIDCNSLTELPENLCHFQSLRSFVMSRCSRIVQVGSPSSRMERYLLKSLQRFRIDHCDGLTSIARGMLDYASSLKFLAVCECPNLVSFPLDLQRTPSLSEIKLYNCPELFTNNNNMLRGFGHLTCLKSLSIGPFVDHASVELFDWSGLTSCSSTLSRLRLCGLPHMESLLPDQIQHLTSLTSLYLEDFELLEALPDWLGSLMSLEELFLWKCQKLQNLPSAPAMGRLSKLRLMDAYNCPLLKKSFRLDRGPESEWFKISRVSNVFIR